jgi:hypothetical protein
LILVIVEELAWLLFANREFKNRKLHGPAALDYDLEWTISRTIKRTKSRAGLREANDVSFIDKPIEFREPMYYGLLSVRMDRV